MPRRNARITSRPPRWPQETESGPLRTLVQQDSSTLPIDAFAGDRMMIDTGRLRERGLDDRYMGSVSFYTERLPSGIAFTLICHMQYSRRIGGLTLNDPIIMSSTAVPGGSERRLGVFMLLASGFCFSTAGVFIRLIEEADVWQVVFYRAASFGLAILIVVAVQRRGAMWRVFSEIGGFCLIGSAGLTVGAVFVVWAQFHTTVANVVFVLGALPFLSALLARLLLQEEVSGLTWLAMLTALVGIGVMVYGGMEAGRLLGNILAIIAIAGFAVMTVALRKGRSSEMRPVFVLGSVGAVVVSLVVGVDLDVNANDLIYTVAMGAFSMGVGFLLFNRGARSVRAGEMWILSNVEIVLAPVLVWLFVAEIPLLTTFLGGAIVVCAILSQAVMTARDQAAE